MESFAKRFQGRRVFWQNFDEFLEIVEVLELEVRFDQPFSVLCRLVILRSLLPLASLGRIISETLVSFLEFLVVSCPLLDELDNSGPVAEFASHVEGQILPINSSVNLLCLVEPAEPGADLRLLLVLLVKILKPLDELDSIVAISFDKRSLRDIQVHFLESGFRNESPEARVWILLDELRSLLQANSGQEISRIFQRLGLVMRDHFVDVFDVFWIFQDLI